MNEILKTIDIVIPVHNESGNIFALFSEIKKEIVGKFDKIKLIIIDDRSNDSTSTVIAKNVEKFPEFAILYIRFTRNFGKEIAVKCGIDHSANDLCAIMDGDLQHPPKYIIDAHQIIEKGESNMIFISQDRKQKHLLHKISTFTYKGILNFLSKEKVYLTDFILMDRKAVKIVQQYNEYDFYTRGILSIVGLNAEEIFYVPQSRFEGKTKFSLLKLINLAIDGIISVSIRPLRLSIFLGIIVSFLSILFGIWLIVEKIRFGQPIPGFATLGFGLFFFAGVQLLFLGLIGEYVGKTYIQTKNRPIYTIDVIKELGS